MKRLAVALALVCFGTGAAKADWEYTRWGMSVAQVASAAKHRTKPSTDLHPDSDGNVTRLTAPYQSENFSFEAQFGFNAASKLASVTLVLEDPSAHSMDMSGDTGGGDMDMSAHRHMGADMKMPPGNCHDLGASVKAAHGPRQGGGAAHMQYSIETWADGQAKNNITYTVLDGVGCYVQYSVMKPQ